MSYNPNLHTFTNKPYGMAQPGPTDARSFYFDSTTSAYRVYADTAEVMAYLTAPAPDVDRYKIGRFSIFIQTGTSVTEYWFNKDAAPIVLADLVPKTVGHADETTFGTVQIATEAEVEIVAPPGAEDAHVVSRMKLFKWWYWLRTQLDASPPTMLTSLRTFTQEFAFALLKLTTPSTAGTAKGHFWFDGTSLQFYKAKIAGTAQEAVITSESNTKLEANPPRVMSADEQGGLTALYDVMEEIVTDSYLIGLCNAAVFAADHTATISPVGTVLYKGQRCIGQPSPPGGPFYLYFTIADNKIVRMTLS